MTATPVPAPTCPQCQTPLGARPFCPRDGAMGTERFVLGERYVAERLLGGGGFAFVYAGRHLVLGKPVAIKVLRDNEASASTSVVARRFLREARNASQLAHENIISILDFGHDAAHDIAYLVMELFAGESLAQVIRTSAPMPASRVVPMLVQLARALASSHEASVVHRDVNPRNVLVGRGDLVKLCDFGLARSFLVDDRVTTTGSVVGTPAYMAPEQLRDETLGTAVDVFGLGCTAYEMLTGKIPHAGETPVALLANRLGDRTLDGLDDLALDIPSELRELVASCLAADPAARPSAAQLETALLAIGAASGPARKLAELTGEMIGSYRVERLLGKGGASSVYLGVHPVIGNKVAIKVIAPHVAAIAGMAERFAQEARASSDLDNPHVPKYFDFGFLDTGQPYAVMEYLEGETLGKLLARDGVQSIARTTEILGQVASAMVPVHAAGIVHRDLKPDNLMLVATADGSTRVKILDFGIAKALAPGSAPAQTSVGMMLGTPQYCAPEQALGLPIAPTADVYAIGAIAFEMLTGRTPFEGGVSAILGAKVTSEAPRARTIRRDLPARIDRDLEAMLARAPERRIAAMAEVASRLASWSAHDTPATTSVAQPRARRWPMLAACGAAASALVIIIAAMTRGGDAPATPVQHAAAVDAALIEIDAAPAIDAPPAIVVPPPVPPAAKPTAKPHHKAAAPSHAPPHDDGVIVNPYGHAP